MEMLDSAVSIWLSPWCGVTAIGKALAPFRPSLQSDREQKCLEVERIFKADMQDAFFYDFLGNRKLKEEREKWKKDLEDMDEEAARKLERYRQIEQVSAIKLQLVDEAKKRKSDAEEAADASMRRCKELQDQLKTTQEQVNELQAELTYLQSEKEKLKKSAVTPEVLAKRNEDLKKQYEDLLQTKTEIEREIGEEKRRRHAEEQTQQSRHLRNSEFWQLSQQIIWPVACGLGICAGLRLSIPKVIQGVTCTWQALGNASRAAQQNTKTNIVDAYKATPWPTKQKKLALSGRGLTLLASGKAGVQSTISAITAERRSGEEQLAALRRPFIAEKRPAPEIWLPRPEFRVSKGCSDGANQVLNHFGSTDGANKVLIEQYAYGAKQILYRIESVDAVKVIMIS